MSSSLFAIGHNLRSVSRTPMVLGQLPGQRWRTASQGARPAFEPKLVPLKQLLAG